MANISKIHLSDVERYDTTLAKWVTLSKLKTATVAKIELVQLYSDVTGFDPSTLTSKSITLNWGSFTAESIAGVVEPAVTIFGSDAGLVPTTAKATRIRYKIQVTSKGTPDTVVTSGYFYQIINFGIPATGAITGLPATTTAGNLSANIVVKVPAITTAMDTDAQNIQAHLTTAANWRIVWTDPNNRGTTIQPSASWGAGFAPVVETGTAEYGGAYVPITLGATLPVAMSGEHKLKVQFYPNDGTALGGTVVTFAQELSCTATVTVNMGSQGAPAIYSIDGTVGMTITFTA